MRDWAMPLAVKAFGKSLQQGEDGLQVSLTAVFRLQVDLGVELPVLSGRLTSAFLIA